MVVIPLFAIAAIRNYPIRIAGSRNHEFRAQAMTRVPAPQRELTPTPHRDTPAWWGDWPILSVRKEFKSESFALKTKRRPKFGMQFSPHELLQSVSFR